MTQPLPLSEQLKNLELLQELDLKIDSLKKNQNSLPANLKSLDDSITKLQATLEVKKGLLAEIEKVNRQTQAALDLNKDRLGRSNDKLDGVHNSQEFQAANKEIEQLKKLNASLEEQAVKSNLEAEKIQKELSLLTEQLTQLQGDRQVQAALLLSQENQFKSDIMALTSERDQYLSKIEVKILAQYNRIRPARAGLGIVPAVGGRCKGCNMMVPPQLYNEIHRGTTLHSCPCCHRLLYIPSAGIENTETNQSK